MPLPPPDPVKKLRGAKWVQYVPKFTGDFTL